MRQFYVHPSSQGCSGHLQVLDKVHQVWLLEVAFVFDDPLLVPAVAGLLAELQFREDHSFALAVANDGVEAWHGEWDFFVRLVRLVRFVPAGRRLGRSHRNSRGGGRGRGHARGRSGHAFPRDLDNLLARGAVDKLKIPRAGAADLDGELVGRTRDHRAYPKDVRLRELGNLRNTVATPAKCKPQGLEHKWLGT